MNSERGSLWRKWDFHVHTPYSILNNEYGYNPYEDYEGHDPFDEYVKTLFEKAVEEEIAAIGITDYFSIEGYKRIRNEYLQNPEKMMELFPDESLRKKIYDILILPNIELRINTFVGEKKASINYHVLFSDSVNIIDIEDSFLKQLKIPHSPNNVLPLTRHNIERVGKEYKEHNDDKNGTDYLVGLELSTVNYDQLMEALNSCPIFEGKYLISIPMDEALSDIKWNGRDYQTRKILYQQCDLIMSSNPGTRKWALGEGNEDEQIAEFGKLKPCIWGSDAHSFERMFHPYEERYCWIKADPTFEGLLQILYEPAERVRIQKDKPTVADEHKIIDHISFHNAAVQNEPIYLSDNLTTIIGGKSTGKSILLRHIARGADLNQVTEKENKVPIYSQNESFKADVVWKDGASGQRRIIYIPQSYLNRIVDDRKGDSELNRILEEILLQQEVIKSADYALKNHVKMILDMVKHDILDYMTAYLSYQENESILRKEGRSDAFQSTIDRLRKQKEELSAKVGLTASDLQRHAELEGLIAKLNLELLSVRSELSQVNLQQDPFVYLPSITKVNSDGKAQYDYSMLPATKEFIDGFIQSQNKSILQIWIQVVQKTKQLLSEREKDLLVEIERQKAEYLPLQEMVSRNEEMNRIEEHLHIEKEKLDRTLKIEDSKNADLAKIEDIRVKIIESRKALKREYDLFSDAVLSINNAGSELEFSADILENEKQLFDAINGLFDNRSFSSFKYRHHYNLADIDSVVVDDKFFYALWDGMLDGTLPFKGGNNLQTALDRLFSNWYYIHYSVKSGEDMIANMSPGKKALVLLEMIVNLDKSNCPILIDQPEDDLDNRSIYKNLVTYIKRKKHERQIIVATHNANIVIGADAEEVIIANQNGKETPNNSYRFEYRSGSIENVSPLMGENGKIMDGVLYQKGIQSQICDILEGGKEAFELRRQKYIRTLGNRE